MSLVDEIARAKAKALNDGDAKMAAELSIAPTQIDLGDDVRLRLQLFGQWCERHSVRTCPCRPTTIAQWVLEHGHLGADNVMAMLAAVEALHFYHGLGSPTKAPIVSRALEQHFKAEPPRSWPAADKLLFAALPQDIQQIIGRRERDREREIRRAQNRAAEAEKKLKELETKSIERKELTNEQIP